MDKLVRTILFVIVVLLIINVLLTYFGKDNISAIRDNLQSAKRSADSALQEIKYSQTRLEEMKIDIGNFRSNMDTIQQSVASNDEEKKEHEARELARLTKLKNAIEDFKPELEPMNLPEIDIRNLEK